MNLENFLGKAAQFSVTLEWFIETSRNFNTLAYLHNMHMSLSTLFFYSVANILQIIVIFFYYQVFN